MKPTFTKTLLFFIAIIFASMGMRSQDILDVPPLDDQNQPTLAEVIMADTTATGERVPNRVYRLQRNGIYIMSATITANYPISIIADGDNTQRPPIIASGKDAQGANVRPLFRMTGDGTTHSFKDIIFQGVDLERKYDTEWFQGLDFIADDMHVTFQGCVFNSYTGGATQFYGSKDISIFFRDCTWRNGVSTTHPFIGQQVTMPALQMDTLVVTNCTYFNNNAFWLFQENGLAKFTVIEHNTIFTSVIDAMRLRFTSNTNIRSNLFYGTHAFGDTPTSRERGWYEPDNTGYSIISLYEVPSGILDDAGITEADRVVNLTNNAYFTPQAIKDYWDADATISDIVFMNERTTALFSDNDGHPFFNDADNMEKDPMFVDSEMDTRIASEVALWCSNYRATGSNNGHELNGNGGSNRNYDDIQRVDILSGLQWPLPESMAYADVDLLVGGHDGLPIGDLNWDPAKRAQYVEPTVIEKGTVAPSDPIGNIKIPALKGDFFAKWTVNPSHAPMDGVTGFGQGAAPSQGFSQMGILVRFGASGMVDARNGGAYEAVGELAYEAGTTYTIEVRGNVKSQTYSVDVIPDGGNRVTIGTDYAFRTDNPQDILNYFSMVINELEQFGGVVGSDLNPSFLDDPFTSNSYELNLANNTTIEPQAATFKASFDMMPTVQGIDAVVSFAGADAVVQGYSALSAILRCNQAGMIDARDGGAYSSNNELTYEAGTTYSVVMDFDVAAQTYSATVTPEGGAAVEIAKDFAFRAPAESLTTFAKLIGIGGMFGGNSGDLVVSNFNISTGDEPFANQKTPALTGNFFAKWTVTPTHAPMDGATGLGKEEAPAQGFSAMGILVRFGASGMIDARNGGAYETINELAYEAGTTYTIEVRGNVQSQTYSVDVIPDGGARVTIGTDYGFRTNNPQDVLNYFSMVINELEQFGGVVGSRLNPSFMDDPYTSSSYELNLANNDVIEAQAATFRASFDMMPTVQGIDAVVSFASAEAVVQGYSGLSAILRCNQAGMIDARDGGAYSSNNELTYEAGTIYSVVMDFDVAAQTYSATVTPEGGAAVEIAKDFAFRAPAESLTTFAKLIGIGGMFGGNPGDLVVSNFNISTGGEPFANVEIPALTGNFFAKWKVTPTHANMDGATGFGQEQAPEQGFSAMGILVRFGANGMIDARNGGAYEALGDLAYEAGTTYTIEVSGNVPSQTYSVDVIPDGGARVTIGTDYAFRVNNPQDQLNYFSMVINELEQFGGIVGSRLNPSFTDDPYTSDSYELNLANNAAIEEQAGGFTASFDMTPTVQGIDAVVAFSDAEAVVQGYSALSAILRCNQAGMIDARDGGAYSSDNELPYTAGTTYGVVMSFDVVAQTYSVMVTPDGGDAVELATNYAFRASAESLSNVAQLTGVGGMFGGNPGSLVIANFDIGSTAVNDIDAPKFKFFPSPANDHLIVSSLENIKQIEIYNLLGLRLMSTPIKKVLNQSIDISRLPSGVFILMVSSEEGIGAKRFVKQ